jgi:hypothetical protein
MRQLLYISTSTERQLTQSLGNILARSRARNAADGLTGLLWTDGTRFLQILEGPTEAVGTTFERIRQDPRHRAVVVLHDRMVDTRSFGNWSMALHDDSDARLSAALASASPEVRATFEGLAAARRAA